MRDFNVERMCPPCTSLSRNMFPTWKFKLSDNSRLSQNKLIVYHRLRKKCSHVCSDSCHPKHKKRKSWLRSLFGFQGREKMISKLVSPSSIRGHGQLSWTLGDASRSVSSEGVSVEPCGDRHPPHSHCSNLTISILSASDTGTYTCTYSTDGLDHTASTYVYVQGETVKTFVIGIPQWVLRFYRRF